jgi:oxygen-independent coproporphyrinogen III oxidase
MNSSPSGYGVYVHIPWCLGKCAYCDFPSRPLPGPEVWAPYLEALTREIRLRARGTADTVYVGGGTPSLCPVPELAKLMRVLAEHLPFAPNAEVTLEANPATVDPAALAELRALGFNRLSVGVQSTSEAWLRLLERRHTSSQARATLESARCAGFDNLSADLIYGLPGQTLPDFQNDLKTLAEWGPDHLSLYALSVEPGTRLEAALNEGRLVWPDEDQAADMYAWAREFLSSRGFLQYELSNFALPGRECRHNLRYWHDQDYFGFGAAAHSYLQGVRSWNESDPSAYQRALLEKNSALAGQETLTGNHRVAETLILGLRLTQGLQSPSLRARFGESWAENFQLRFAELSRQGLLRMEKENICLTPKGMLLSNVVFREIL